MKRANKVTSHRPGKLSPVSFTPGRRALVSLALSGLLLFLIGGPAQAEKDGPAPLSMPAAIPSKFLKTIIVGDYYPYTFFNDQGVADGFSVELAQAVTRVMDRQLEIGLATWEQAKKALEIGAIDFLPMMASSPERDKVFDFSVPHTIAFDAAFVKKGSPGIRSPADLAGKTIIVMNKDAAHDYLLSKGMPYSQKLILVSNLPEGLRTLNAGRGDVALMPKLVGLIVMKRLGLTNLDSSPGVMEAYNRPFCLAVKDGNQVLLERLSQGLSIIKTTGQYDEIYKRWFGAVEPAGWPWQSVLKYMVWVAVGFTFMASGLFLWNVSLRKQVGLRTERLEAEVRERGMTNEALRESEEKHRLAMEATSDGLWDWNIPTGGVYYSPAWERILGLSDVRPEYASWESRLHPEDRDSILFSLQDHLTGKTARWEQEHRLQTASGEWKWVLGRGTVVARDPEGRPLRLVGTLTDISGRKRAEEALVEAKNDWEYTFNSVTDMITIHDQDFNIIRANPAARELLGMPLLERIPAEKCFRYYHGAENPPPGCPSCQCLQTRRPSVTEVFEPYLNRHLEIRAMPRFGSDQKLSGLIHIVRDITERRQAEEEKATLEEQFHQAQKMESVGRLAGGVAHDLNNLLSPILGYGEMLLDDLSADDARRRSVKQIVGAGKRARDVVRQLLAFSRKQILEFKPLDLNQVLTGFEKLLRRMIREDIALRIILAPALPPVRGDIGQIEQILMNLAVNAQDAMPEGGRLTIETAVVDLDEAYALAHKDVNPGRHVLLTVSDSGQGMDAETQRQIFEPFFTTKEKGKGTGLGLSTVYGIVKQHGGHLWVYSEPGRGTAFKVYLPCSRGEAGEDQAPPSSLVSPPSSGTHSETILLVEDNEMVRDLARVILSKLGYTVLVAEDGEEALSVLGQRDRPVHLLLTDVVMPGMNGRDLYLRMADNYPDLKVLYMSGYTDTEIAHHGVLEAGVHFIQKPFTVTTLDLKVREALGA